MATGAYLGLRLGIDELDALRRLSEDRGTSMSEQMRQAIRGHLAENDVRPRMAAPGVAPAPPALEAPARGQA